MSCDLCEELRRRGTAELLPIDDTDEDAFANGYSGLVAELADDNGPFLRVTAHVLGHEMFLCHYRVDKCPVCGRDLAEMLEEAWPD